jgi:hypothetical protein
MEDFIRRAKSQLRFLAMDISNEFYKHLIKNYIEKEKGWPFEVMEEVTLYDGRGMEIFKKGTESWPGPFPESVKTVETSLGRLLTLHL